MQNIYDFTNVYAYIFPIPQGDLRIAHEKQTNNITHIKGGKRYEDDNSGNKQRR